VNRLHKENSLKVLIDSLINLLLAYKLENPRKSMGVTRLDRHVVRRHRSNV
jgi:hypothetical protein